MRILILICLTCIRLASATAQQQEKKPPDATSEQIAGLRQQAQATLSVTTGTLTLPGLRQTVNVLRDKWGVAHIYAQNQHDLFFAQGYVASQDRLFQMELWKRVGQGRLAEVLGPQALERDVNARLLRYRGDMNQEYAAYGPDTKEILTAFTDGINAFIRERRISPQGFPIEFKLAGFEPEEWKPEDCLMRMAGYPMTGNSSAELYHAQLVTALGAEKARALLDLTPSVKLDPVPGVDYSGLTPELLRNLVGSDTRIEFPSVQPPTQIPSAAKAGSDDGSYGTAASRAPSKPIEGYLWSEASNNWTVSGRLTRSGKPILANDPHRTIALPSLRYIVHLVAPAEAGKPETEWNVIGAGEPGLPGVAAGHNQSIAWGFTVFPIDQQDLYVEELNPANPLQYKIPGGWATMQVQQETFRVRGQEPVTRELRFTAHGPVLWSGAKRALVLKWVGAEPGTAGYLGSLALDRARNWTQFLEAMQRWKVPAENIVYADIYGNIGEQSAGLAPLRKSWTGLLPVEGASGKYEWSGLIPLDQLPRWYNPPEGFVATANDNVIAPNYPYHIGYEWSAPYRVHRIQELLRAGSRNGDKLDLDATARIQTDVTSLAAQTLLTLLRRAAPKSDDINVKMLLAWNGEVTRDSAAAALYEVWINSLKHALTLRLLQSPGKSADEKLVRLVESRMPMPLVIDLLRTPTKEVFGENAAEERNKLMLSALQAASRDLARLQGSDPKSWSWGKLHEVRFRHPLDQIMPGAAEVFDLGPLERPGDGTTVNATSGANYSQTHGASYREILDTSNWDNSRAVNTPGQSGQPASPHYGDLMPLWDRGEYFPLVFSRDAVEKSAVDKLLLQPATPQ